ncbi:MAG TPA: hypothetical protein VG986_00220 [Pseudolabrys sp.]|nr:hypothetical protein [Pseudolabrys sp.]
MKRNAMLVIGLAAALCGASLLAGNAHASDKDYRYTRQKAGSNAMPKLGPGEYGTDTDNQNNAGTGVADGDMGGTGAPCVFNTDSYSPIEFDITIPKTAAGSPGNLHMNVWDVDTNTIPSDPEIDKVYLNNTSLGTLTGKDNTWGVNYFNIPPGVLKAGKNRVKITPDTGNPGGSHWCVAVEWGIIKVTPTTTDIVRAWVAPVRTKAGQFVNFFAEVTGDFDSIQVLNSVGTKLVVLTNPDGDNTWSAQWRVPASTPKGDFKFSMKGLKAGKVVSTWPAIKLQ